MHGRHAGELVMEGARGERMRTAGLYYPLGWPAPAASPVISRVISRLVSATITLLGDGSAASSRERTEDDEEWREMTGDNGR